MNCPHCRSPKVHGPVYHTARNGRRTATMLCRNCQSAFDPYDWFGAGSTRAAA